MAQRTKLERFERSVEEGMTVVKRLAFSVFETGMFCFGLYQFAKLVMRF